MKELYEIMKNLLDIEYKQKSLICLIQRLDAAYESEEQRELKMLLLNMSILMRSVKDDMRITIEELDNYIINNKNKQ